MPFVDPADGPLPLGWCAPAACFTDPERAEDTGHGRWRGAPAGDDGVQVDESFGPSTVAA